MDWRYRSGPGTASCSGNSVSSFVVTSIGDFDTADAILLETITWCSSRDLKSLRTPQIRPRVLEASYRGAVRSVVSSRRLQLGRTPQVASVPRGGRLLAYFPDAELACGTSESSSEGFFDVNNAPPWDTWLLFAEQPGQSSKAYETCLVSWVPPTFVDRAQRGIEVNPEECICWLEDCSPELQDAVGRCLSHGPNQR